MSSKNVAGHLSPWIIDGIHWWNGAAAILIISEIVIKKILILWVILILNNLIRIKIEAVAWIIKYFSAASLWYLLFFFKIRGINNIKLISRATHVISQELVEIIKRIEDTIIVKNSMFEGWSNIQKR